LQTVFGGANLQITVVFCCSKVMQITERLTDWRSGLHYYEICFLIKKSLK